MNTFSILLTIATLCCALVAGITLIFGIVIMPGLETLGERRFLEGFKAIDRVIQGNQPIFLAVWLGSTLTLIATTVLGFRTLEGIDQAFLMAALLFYLLGVQITTATVNVPLNNQLQRQELTQLDSDEIKQAVEDFAPRWILWNHIRTEFAILTTLLLLVVLLRF